jgi:hypothetical protein
MLREKRSHGRRIEAARANPGKSIAMIWFLLEALVALLLAVFIVWFTMGGKRKRAPPRPNGEDGE